MILTILLCIIAFLSITQPTAPRLFAALIFIILVFLHDLFLSDLDGFKYYATCALNNLLVIILTAGINPIPKMVIRLHVVCLIAALLNMIGYILWYNYYSSDAYDISFLVIYMYTAFIFIDRDIEHVGGFASSKWRACFHFHHSSMFHYLRKNKGPT